MKKAFIFFIIIFSKTFFAQNCFPFNLDILEQYSGAADTIRPVYKKGGFSFVNISSGKNVFPMHFQEAYPFFGDVAIVKYDDKYNLINKKGDFLIKKSVQDFIGKPYLRADYPNEVGLNRYYIHLYDSTRSGRNNSNDEFQSIRSMSIYKSENSKYGLSCQDRIGQLQLPAKYDTIISISENFVLAKINGKYGLDDASAQNIIPYEYDEAVPLNKQNKWRNIQNFFGFRKGEKWYYFNFKGELIVKTGYKADAIATVSDEIIGTIRKGSTLSILYKDGELKDFGFDKVSEKGNIGFIGNGVYFINDNKTISKYYSGDDNKNPDKIFRSYYSAYGSWSEMTVDENFVIAKNSKGRIVKRETDKNIWNSLTVDFDWCNYYDIPEAGNRTKVDGTDIVTRICTGGLCFPKYTGDFYSGSEKMQNFNYILDKYFDDFWSKETQK